MGWEADSCWQWQSRKQWLGSVPWSLLHILLVGSLSWWPPWPLLPEVIGDLVAKLSFASILTLLSLQSGTSKTTTPWHLLPLISRLVLWTFICLSALFPFLSCQSSSPWFSHSSSSRSSHSFSSSSYSPCSILHALRSSYQFRYFQTLWQHTNLPCSALTSFGYLLIVITRSFRASSHSLCLKLRHILQDPLVIPVCY